MAIEKMRLVRIDGRLEAFDEVLSEICVTAMLQPEQAQSFYSSSTGLVPFSEENAAAQKMSELESFAKTAGVKLKLKHRSEYHEFMNSITSDDGFFNDLSEKIKDFSEEKAALCEQKQMCLDGIETYSHFKGLEADFGEINECRYIKPRFGHMPKAYYNRLVSMGIVKSETDKTGKSTEPSELVKNHPFLNFFPCTLTDNECWGVYFAPADHPDEVDGLFASMLFERIIGSEVTGTIEEILNGLEENINVVNSRIQKLDESIAGLCRDESEHINRYYTKLAFDSARTELKNNCCHNDEYFYLAGWVPKKHEKEFGERMKRIAPDMDIVFSDPDVNTKVSPPVRITGMAKLLSFIVGPYKYYVNMYGTPSYYDLDITGFVAVTYTVLFGMMFGDMGQGLVLALVGFGMWKLKQMELGKILIPCGISSMFFGFIFGSVFGYEEMLDPVYKKLGMNGKPVEVMESVNFVLLVAIGIGVGLVAAAILMNIAGCIKRRCFGEAIFSQNGIVGLALYVCGVNLASGFMGGPTVIASKICFIVIGVCAVLLVIKEIPIEAIDRHHLEKPESIGDFLLQNLFELLEYILSYMSNTVSFLRVGAFVLVHAGMMMVVFSLAGENQNLVVIVLGNVLVIALEGLLTGIQALRLEYYEMFSRFYIGDGRPYKPAKARRKA